MIAPGEASEPGDNDFVKVPACEWGLASKVMCVSIISNTNHPSIANEQLE